MKKISGFKKGTNKSELSPFAIFCKESHGIQYQTESGYNLDKWEVFHMGYKPESIIAGKTRIKAIKI